MEGETLHELRTLLDNARGFAILNDPDFLAAMRALVASIGSATRAEVAAQAFAFAIELERERAKAMIQLGTWRCHDHQMPGEPLNPYTLKIIFGLGPGAGE